MSLVPDVVVHFQIVVAKQLYGVVLSAVTSQVLRASHPV